jgi:DNA-3-methyladenine glycosylase
LATLNPAPAIDPSFFQQDAPAVARGLIGAMLLVNGAGGRIVETEAYDMNDPASHSFGGQKPRNAVMFGPSGRAYIYRIYGLHWCLNTVAGKTGSAVLIRALEPMHGIADIAARRGVSDPRLLCSGPGRLCQAPGVDGSLNGASLSDAPFQLFAPCDQAPITVGRRIGINAGVDTPWRFGLSNSPFLSRRFPA